MANNAEKAGRLAFASGAISALAVANTYRPFTDRGYTTLLAYGAGLVPSELPLHTAALIGASAAVQVARGALRTPSGRAGTVLSAAAVFGLVELHRQARGDQEVLDAALDKAFDPATLVSGVTPPPPSWRTNPFPRRRHALVHAADVAYGPAGPANHLDVWCRPDLAATGGAPVLMQIHGGAWTTGRKEVEAQPLLRLLVDAGWVCVAINYRLSPKATWPAHIIDVKRAISWVRANIADYGGDPSFLAVTGGSAGGHLSSVAALTPNDPELQPGFEDADTSVQAAVPHYGAFDIWDESGTGNLETLDFFERTVMKARRSDRPPGWRQASPVDLPMTDAPPFFVVHGGVDALIPTDSPRLMVSRLRSESTNPVAYAELPRARHAFDMFDSSRTRRVNATVLRFLETVRRMR